MAPVPVKESTFDDIDETYERNQEPFKISREGRPSYYVMRISEEEQEEPLSEAEIAALKTGYQDYLDGNVVDADVMIAEILAKYGL